MSKGPRHRRGPSYFPVCTGSAVDAVRPQLLLRRQFCAAVCRGRWRAQPSATKERYGCGHPLRVHIGPLVRIHRTASFVVTLQPSLRGPTFSALPEKVGQKEALDTDRIVPQATEEPRRRTLRPAHDKLSANLHYSAACAGTTLPSGAVATQGDGKTRCCGNNKPPTYAPVVDNICVLL